MEDMRFLQVSYLTNFIPFSLQWRRVHLPSLPFSFPSFGLPFWLIAKKMLKRDFL